MAVKRLIVDVGLFGQVEVPPVYVSSEIGTQGADVIRVTISETLDFAYTPNILNFALSGTSAAVSSVTMYALQNYFDLNLDQNAAKTDVINVFYTQPSINFLRNLVGGKVLPFGPELVTNNIDAVNAPEPFKIAAKSTTEMYLEWNGIGEATNYQLERDLDNTFSSPTLVYNGPNLTFVDSSLLIDTEYFYRAKSISDNPSKLDSDWVVKSQKTITFMPELWIEPMGMIQDGDNDYGTLTASAIDVIKSIVNTAITLSPTLSNRIIDRSSEYSTPTNRIEGSSESNYLMDTPVSLDDFTFIFNIRHTAGTPRGLMGNSLAANQLIDLDSISRFSFTITGTKYRLDLLTPLEDKYEFIIVQRTGTNIRISRDGGQTWDETLTVKTDAFVLDTLFNNTVNAGFTGGLGRTVIAPLALTTDQIAEVINFQAQALFTPDIETNSTIDILGVTYTDLVNDYYDDPDLRAQLGNYRRSFAVINEADKTLILGQNKDDYNDYCYVFDHTTGKISLKTAWGLDGPIEESHQYGGHFFRDLRIGHLEPYPWYDQATTNTAVFKTSGKQYDLGSIKQSILNNGISSEVLSKSGYHGISFFSDGSAYVTHQERHLVDGTRFINVGKVVNDNSFANYRRILDTIGGGANQWPYPWIVYNQYNDEILLFINLFNQPISKFDYVFFLRSSDGLNWSNLEGTFNKDIDALNTITWAELTANCLIVDASSELESCRMHDAHISPSGEIFGYIGNGDDTYSVFRGTPGGSFVKTPITWDGHTPITSRDQEGGYITIAGTQIDIYHLEDQAGNNQIIHIRSVDDGTTWLFIETLTTAAFDHVDIIGTANQFNSEGNLTLATVYDKGTNGVMYVKELSSL